MRKLTLGNNLALQNSALDVGVAGGKFALNNSVGNITGFAVAASPTFGGLEGSSSLLSVFTTAGGNNESNMASNRVLGFTLNPGTGVSHAYSGTISDFASGVSLPMTKTGNGSQEFAGSNSYTGTTTISGGTLKISHANGLSFGGRATTSPGTTTVNSGASVDLNGITGINEPIILNGNGVGGNGALLNHSVSPAGISNGIAALTLPATGSGSGYGTTAPTVLSVETGSGATATASLGNSTTASITSVTGGVAWAVGDTMIINNASGNGAIAQVTGVSSGAVTGLSITKAGAGFTAVSLMTIAKLTGASTTNPTISWNATNFTVGAIQLTNAGSGYSGTPTVTFSAGNASNGDVTKTLSSVVLASGSSIGGTGDTTIAASVSESGGARGLAKVGGGTLTLTGSTPTPARPASPAARSRCRRQPDITHHRGRRRLTGLHPRFADGLHRLGPPDHRDERITGTVDNASDYLLMTASTITGTPTLASLIANYATPEGCRRHPTQARSHQRLRLRYLEIRQRSQRKSERRLRWRRRQQRRRIRARRPCDHQRPRQAAGSLHQRRQPALHLPPQTVLHRPRQDHRNDRGGHRPRHLALTLALRRAQCRHGWCHQSWRHRRGRRSG